MMFSSLVAHLPLEDMNFRLSLVKAVGFCGVIVEPKPLNV